MSGFDFRAFSRRNRARSESSRGFKHGVSSWSRSEWLVVTMGEVGELSAALLDFGRAASAPEVSSPARIAALRKNLADEIADVFIYLDLAMQEADIVGYPPSRRVSAMLVSELAELEHIAVYMGWGSAHWLAPLVTALGGVCSTIKQINRIRQGIAGNKPGASLGKLESDYADGMSRSVCFLEHLANKCGIVLCDAVVSKFEETSKRIGYVELQS